MAYGIDVGVDVGVSVGVDVGAFVLVGGTGVLVGFPSTTTDTANEAPNIWPSASDKRQYAV